MNLGRALFQAAVAAISICSASLFADIRVSHLLAAENKGAIPQASTGEYRRVFVPAESPEDWPVGSERFLPVSNADFLPLVSGSQNPPRPVATSQARLNEGFYRAEFDSTGTLQVSAELAVEVFGGQPQFVALAPLNLAVQTAHWQQAPNQPAEIGLWAQPDKSTKYGVLASQSDKLIIAGRLAAQTPLAARKDYLLETPIVVPQVFELHLPANRTASVSQAELLRTEYGTLGESVWVFQLAPHELHHVRIRPSNASEEMRVLPFVSQSTSYQLNPAGLDFVTELRVEPGKPSITELKAALPAGTRVVKITVDEQAVDWQVREEESGKSLVIAWPQSSQPQIAQIRCLAKIRSGLTWELPKLAFDQVAWTEGTSSLLVSPDIELKSLVPHECSLQHIVGITDLEQEGEVFRLQEWSQNAAIDVIISRPQAQLIVQSLTSIEVGPDKDKLRIAAILSSIGSEIYQTQATILPGWNIESVRATPKSALNEWHADYSGNSAKLNMNWSRPVSRRHPVQIEIEVSSTSDKSLLPATLGKLKPLRFLNADVSAELLEISNLKPQQLALAPRMDRALIEPDEPVDGPGLELRELVSKNPTTTVLDVSMLDDTEVLEFGTEQAQYSAEVRIAVDAFPDSISQQIELDCQQISGAISGIVIESSLPLPDSLSWKLANGNATVSMTRVETNSDTSVIGELPRYILTFSESLAEDFSLRATLSRPAQASEACYLLQLPEAIEWSESVLLRGSLESLQVFDQGLTPSAVPDTADDDPAMPLLGAYRIGPEEFRRGNNLVELTLRRQSVGTIAPSLVAWLAEYQTLQGADGASLHSANYSLENLGSHVAQVDLPEGSVLHEAWLNNQQLKFSKIVAESNSYEFRLDKMGRWHHLGLKYSTHGQQLGISARIEPALPDCSFPVNLSRWTLWAPEQYEIDNAVQSYSSQRYHWWKRMFGPLARSREETIFDPTSPTRWVELWSAPLEVQNAKQMTGALANQLIVGLQANPGLSFGGLLVELVQNEKLEKLFCVDRAALLSRGIQANTLCGELAESTSGDDTLGPRANPLSRYHLALLASPGAIVLTTDERVAHWHDQVRPTRVSGVFLVNSDDLSDSLRQLRSTNSSAYVAAMNWLELPRPRSTPWTRAESTILSDVGRQAQTIEFTKELPNVVVRRAHVQRSLWYALLLLTIVIGVWRLAHYPNAMILLAALAAAACLIAPTYWLTVPQAVFLGLLGASLVRVAIKSSQFADDRLDSSSGVATTTVTLLLLSMFFSGNPAFAQPESKSEEAVASISRLPKVLIPIDAEGVPQGEEVYVSETFLQKLQESSSRPAFDGSDFVILVAKYSGKLPNQTDGSEASADPRLDDWVLLLKVETFQPNRRLQLPFRRSEAIWHENAHRLNGLPCKLDWQPDGEGCAVTLLEPGLHWLRIHCQPIVENGGDAGKIRLHVPPLPGAILELSHAADVENVRVTSASPIPITEDLKKTQFLLGSENLIDLRWKSPQRTDRKDSWEKLDQSTWLNIDTATGQVDVELRLAGCQESLDLINLEVSSDLKLIEPESDSPVTRVSILDPEHPERIQLALRAGLPSEFVLPLRFEVQRSTSVGQYYLPKIRVIGKPADTNAFAVSVAAGLSYEEQSSNAFQGIDPIDFLARWSSKVEEPLFAYTLGQQVPDWSLRVRPDPNSFSVQQALRLECLTNVVRIQYEAELENLTGSWLAHRLAVPENFVISSITVREKSEEQPLPLRWSRVSNTEVSIFLSRPLQDSHSILVQGKLYASQQGEIQLPKMHLLGSRRGEMHMDLYRSDDVQLDWTDPENAPQTLQGQRLPQDKQEVHVGHFSWRVSQTDELSRLRIQRNRQLYDTRSVTIIEKDSGDWRARLSSRISVRKGVLSQLRIDLPDNFRPPYKLLPEQLGVIDDTSTTVSGKREITVLLSQSVVAGDEITIQLSGTLSLPADKSLIAPSLSWNEARRKRRYVLLPTLVDGETVIWHTSGLRRQALPASLAEFATQREPAQCFRIGQQSFTARQQNSRGVLQNAQVRHSTITGVLDATGGLIVTAELLVQPGRASSCAVELPPNSHLSQLIVGDLPARRDLRADGTWMVPLGPPFLPQRVLVSYRSHSEVRGGRIRLEAPRILLGDQALPVFETRWRIRTPAGVLLTPAELGESSTERDFLLTGYRTSLAILQDAFSQALELPLEEGQAWAQTWQGIVRRAKGNWESFAQATGEKSEAAAELETLPALKEAFSKANPGAADNSQSLTYPPNWSKSLKPTSAQAEYFFAGDSTGQIVIALSRSTQQSVWQWCLALGLIGGVLALVLRLRQSPEFYHDLCHWPRSLALAGGFSWWLLLKPSALGMLVIAVTLCSVALERWRSNRRVHRERQGTELIVPAG